MKSLAVVIALVSILAISGLAQDNGSAQPSQANSRGIGERGLERISQEVHHELVLLPYYGVFDNLAYKVQPDGTVVLAGQVARPTLKSDSENVVKKIEGVSRVDNQIEVLPTSPMDDQIRRATFRAIYGNEALSTYAVRAVPPIHIIVNNGHVTLEGAVARQMDSQLAETQAKAVPNVFSVTNHLQVDQ